MAFFEAFSGRHGEYGLAERVDVRGAMIERLQRPSVLARVVRPPADEPLTAARGRIGDSIQALAAGARTPFAALYRLVMYTSLITGFQAVARTLRCQYVLEIKPDPIVLAMIFALTVFVYGRDRLTGADADSAADGRTRWVVAHRHGLKAFVNACGLLGLVLTLFAPTTIPLLAVTLGLALVYTTRCFPADAASSRCRASKPSSWPPYGRLCASGCRSPRPTTAGEFVSCW
jgi:hypothetical protein